MEDRELDGFIQVKKNILDIIFKITSILKASVAIPDYLTWNIHKFNVKYSRAVSSLETATTAWFIMDIIAIAKFGYKSQKN